MSNGQRRKREEDEADSFASKVVTAGLGIGALAVLGYGLWKTKEFLETETKNKKTKGNKLKL